MLASEDIEVLVERSVKEFIRLRMTGRDLHTRMYKADGLYGPLGW